MPECRAAAIILASCNKSANKHLFKANKLDEPIFVSVNYQLHNYINGYKKISKKAVAELGDLDIAGLYVDETP